MEFAHPDAAGGDIRFSECGFSSVSGHGRAD